MRLFRHWKVTTCPLRLHLEKAEESQENATKSLSGKKGTYCIFSCSFFPHPPPPLGKSLVHKERSNYVVPPNSVLSFLRHMGEKKVDQQALMNLVFLSSRYFLVDLSKSSPTVGISFRLAIRRLIQTLLLPPFLLAGISTFLYKLATTFSSGYCFDRKLAINAFLPRTSS